LDSGYLMIAAAKGGFRCASGGLAALRTCSMGGAATYFGWNTGGLGVRCLLTTAECRGVDKQGTSCMVKDRGKDNARPEDGSNGVFPTWSLPDLPAAIGTEIGPYKLVSVLGEGGIGIVYRAEQKRPVRREVALKVIKPGMDSKQVISRFEAERQALALLDHPNIARVFDAGTTEKGRPYFVMEHVKGTPITEYCDRNKLNVEERLGLFIQVCEAIQHAHQKGIIHRDIKPSNILVSTQNDKAVTKVIDFGVAKAIHQPLTERTLFTEQGQLIGTPLYMSPEQAELTKEDIDTRSDIYSLGVLLYELLTGILPFDSETFQRAAFDEILRIIRDEEPPRPSTRLLEMGEGGTKVAASRRTDIRTLAKRLYKELEWIPLMAMRKERDRRYKTAAELADDIRNYLNGNPLIAGPESVSYRLKKVIKRHRAFVTGVAAVLVVLGVGIIVSTRFAVRAKGDRDKAVEAKGEVEKALKDAEEQRDIAKQERQLADEAREKESIARNQAERSLYVNRVNLAEKYYRESNIGRVRELLDSCRADLRGWEWYHLWSISDQARMTMRTPDVHSVAFSPDGKRIVSGSGDNTLKVWDAESGAELMTLRGHKEYVKSVAFSPDGKRIVSGSWDNMLKVWDANSGAELMTLRGHVSYLESVAFSPDGKRIVSGGWDVTLKVWDADSGDELMTLRGHRGDLRSVAFSPDGKRIVSGSNDNTLKVWDADSGAEVMTLRGHEGDVLSVAFSPDGKRIVSAGSSDHTLKVWDADSGAELMTLRGHKGYVLSVAFSPDGKRIVSGSSDRTLKLWDAESGAELMTLRGHEEIVWSVAFSPDGKRIVSGSHKTLKVWDANSFYEVMTLRGHEGYVFSVAFSPDGKRIVSGGGDMTLKVCYATLKVWDASSGAELMTLRGHEMPVSSVAFSPDGTRIVSGSYDKTLKVWDADSGAELMTLRGHLEDVESIAFSPDGRRIVSGSRDNTLKVWDANSGAEVMTLRGHEDSVTSIAFSPDGRRIVSGSQDNTLKVWDANSGAEVMTLRGHEDSVTSAAFSPDGKRIVSSGGYMLKVWDANSGAELMTLRHVWLVAFSPDGKRIVSASSDMTIKVLDAESGAEVMTLRGHEARVLSVAFSPDGKRIVSGSQDGTLRIWDSARADEVAAFEESELRAREE